MAFRLAEKSHVSKARDLDKHSTGERSDGI